jgi:hypothetical protein
MRAAGELAARVLKFAGTLVKVDTFPSLSVYHNAILLLKSINRVSNPKPALSCVISKDCCVLR